MTNTEILSQQETEKKELRKAIVREIQKIQKKRYKSLLNEDIEFLVREYEQMKFLPQSPKEMKEWIKEFMESKRESLETLREKESILNDLFYSGYPAIHPEIGAMLWNHFTKVVGAEPFRRDGDKDEWVSGFLAFYAEIIPELAEITEEFINESHIELKRRIEEGLIVFPIDISILEVKE